MSKHYVGETGSLLLLDTGILVGSVTEKHIKYRKADGTTTGTWSASLYSSYSALALTTGTYFLSRTLLSTDFDQPGDWVFQAFVAAVDGTWLGESARVTIYDTLQ